MGIAFWKKQFRSYTHIRWVLVYLTLIRITFLVPHSPLCYHQYMCPLLFEVDEACGPRFAFCIWVDFFFLSFRQLFLPFIFPRSRMIFTVYGQCLLIHLTGLLSFAEWTVAFSEWKQFVSVFYRGSVFILDWTFCTFFLLVRVCCIFGMPLQSNTSHAHLVFCLSEVILIVSHSSVFTASHCIRLLSN